MNDTELIFDKFSGKKVLVLGDIMIDEYIRGSVERISPEAPVPIVKLGQREFRIGGAGNVAMNLKGLGAIPILCSVIGKDSASKELINLLNKNNISAEGIIQSESRITTVKTRIVANNQQVVRIDNEININLNDSEEIAFLNCFKEIINHGIDAVIYEDYNKGTLTKNIIENTLSICKELHIATAVDPKKNNFLNYIGVTIFKPNFKELKEGLNIDQLQPNNWDSLELALSQLSKRLNHDISLLTMSENGVYIKDKKDSYHIKAHVRDISDVSGAGDTVIATAVMCYITGASLQLIGEISNIAGGMVCELSGVARISIDSLRNECKRLKV